MASGDLIDYSHISSIVGSSWTATGTISGGNASGVFYFCAPSFYTLQRVKTSGIFASATLTGTYEYYNGSSWVPAGTNTATCSGIGKNNAAVMTHNYVYSPFPDANTSNYHLWRVTLSQSYSGTNHEIYFDYYLGDITKAGIIYYDNYCRNNKIKYCYPTWAGKVSEATFLTNYRPSHFRGNLITSSLAKAVCSASID